MCLHVTITTSEATQTVSISVTVKAINLSTTHLSEIATQNRSEENLNTKE